MPASPIDQETLAALDTTVEIEMQTSRRDGSTSRRPIWVVVVDGDAYVRSWRGPRGAWYRRAVADGRAAVDIGGRTIDVGLVPDDDEELNRRVSDAFRAKYGARSPKSTDEMVTPEVSLTTLRLTRTGSTP